MNRPTAFAAAFINAATAKKDTMDKNWIARQVADRAIHTTVGMVEEKARFNLSRKTVNNLNLV